MHGPWSHECSFTFFNHKQAFLFLRWTKSLKCFTQMFRLLLLRRNRRTYGHTFECRKILEKQHWFVHVKFFAWTKTAKLIAFIWSYFSCLYHETLLLLQGPSALTSGISQLFPEKFCITEELLGDQSKTAFKSQIKTVATNEIRKRDWNADKTPAASRLVFGVPQESLISIIIFLKLLNIQILVMSL